MKPKQPSIRPVGQRSIPSTFSFRSTNRLSVCGKNADFNSGVAKGSGISFSEFLNRKLHRTPVLPGLVKGKEMPFLSSTDCENSITIGEKEKKETQKEEKDFALDIVLQHFKHTNMAKENACFAGDNETGNATADERDESRKRKRGDHVECPKKLLAVLGDDSGIKRGGTKKIATSTEKPKNLFNHYANGGGWWDYNMEGVDNDEVGCAEVWEGMGSTTLGGLDWN